MVLTVASRILRGSEEWQWLGTQGIGTVDPGSGGRNLAGPPQGAPPCLHAPMAGSAGGCDRRAGALVVPKNDMRVLHWHVIPRKLPGVRPMSAAHEICGEPKKLSTACSSAYRPVCCSWESACNTERVHSRCRLLPVDVTSDPMCSSPNVAVQCIG